ncbi:hypothetical protein ACIPF8_21160 [Collimonas sp. NPDC087041]|uniref:hypothetical protein n=1 Tax=Collimonas sp. NPDC087041 TaxID=3363960 RepID=UPI003813FFD4
MNYTESLDHVIHGPTGQPMHTDSAAINTVQSAKDTNMGIWSLMELIKAAGLQGRTFNPDDPESYKLLKTALDSVYAKLSSPAFTGKPTAPTPEQFDNSTKLATTEALMRAGHRYSAVPSIVRATTLTAAAAGALVQCNGGGPYTVVLPSIATFPVGESIKFFSTANLVSITRAGNDSIYLNYSTTTTCVLNIGDTLELVSNGGSWLAVGGSVQAAYSMQRRSVAAASRAPRVSYANSTGKAMLLSVVFSQGSNAQFHAVLSTSSGTVAGEVSNSNGGYGARLNLMVLPGESYSWSYNELLATPFVQSWIETY